MTVSTYFYLNDLNRLVDGSGREISKIDFSFLKEKSFKYLEKKYINGELKTIYELDNDVIKEYEYDENGNLTYKADSYFDQNTYSFKRQYFEDYKYDDKGNLIEFTPYVYDNGEWVFDVNKTKEEYTYDEEGNRLTKTEYVYLPLRNNVVKMNEYAYINNQEKIAFKASYRANGDVYGGTHYQYDEKGNLITEIVEDLDRNTNTIVETRKKEYIYGEDGKLFSEVKYRNYSTYGWVKEQEYIYVNGQTYLPYDLYGNGNPYYLILDTYDENWNPIKTEYFKSSVPNGEWKNWKKIENTYDENGKKLTKTEWEYEEGFWLMKNEEVYDNGKIIFTCDYYGKVVDGMYRQKNEYTYDAGKKQKKESFVYDYDSWVKYHVYTYINGEEKEVCHNLVNEDGIISSKYEYDYDERGNTIKEAYLNYVDDTWVYDYKFEYTYDENNRVLTKIMWKNANNSLTYNYKYENTYAESGLKKETYSEYINGEWRKITYKERNEVFYSATYSADGKTGSKTEIEYTCNFEPYQEIKTELHSNYADGEWTYDFKNETIDSITSKTYIQYKYKNDKWCYIYKQEHVLENRREKMYIDYYYLELDNDWHADTKHEYEYSAYGYETLHLVSKLKDGEWVYNYKCEKKYNNGQLVSQKEYNYVDGKWQEIEKQE